MDCAQQALRLYYSALQADNVQHLQADLIGCVCKSYYIYTPQVQLECLDKVVDRQDKSEIKEVPKKLSQTVPAARVKCFEKIIMLSGVMLTCENVFLVRLLSRRMMPHQLYPSIPE